MMPVSSLRKPILVGEDNPYGGDPRFALYPHPEGCAGWRLCCLLLGMRRTDYLREFARTNLCVGGWSIKAARTAAARIASGPTERKIIALGAKVSDAFGLRFRPYHWVDERILVLPHPSGRCQLWNEEGSFLRAQAAILKHLPELARLIGRVNDDPYDPPEVPEDDWED